MVTALGGCPSEITKSSTGELEVIRTFGEPSVDDIGLVNPAGIVRRSTADTLVDIFAVADKGNNRVVVCRNAESILWKVFSTVSGPNDSLSSPNSLAMTPQEEFFSSPLNSDSIKFYIADSGNDRIVVLSVQGDLIATWGSRGTGPGEFISITGIDVDFENNIYVVDSGNHRIQVFDSTGLFIRSWGGAGSLPGQFSSPIDLSLRFKDGTIVSDVLVSDHGNNRVQVFSPTGVIKFSFDNIPGPRGIDAIDDNGVVESHGYVVTSDFRVIMLGDKTASFSHPFTITGVGDPYDVDGHGTGSLLLRPLLHISDKKNSVVSKLRTK